MLLAAGPTLARMAAAILLAVALIALPGPAAASEQKPAFPVSGSISRAIQRLSGITLMTDVLASKAATLGLKWKLGGRIKARIRTYSLTDLLAGKIKSVEVRLYGSNFKGVPIGQLEISTQGPLWVRYRRKDGQRPGIASPVMINVRGGITESQLAQALADERVASKLRMIKMDLPGLGAQQLQLLDPKVDLSGNRVAVSTLLVTAGADRSTGVPVTVSGQPSVQDNGSTITLTKLKVESQDILDPAEFSSFTEKLFNPLVNFARMDRKDHAFRIKELTVGDGRLDFSGNLLLAPRAATTPAAPRVAKKK